VRRFIGVVAALLSLVLTAASPAFSQTQRFSALDPYLGDAANWEPLNAARWSVAMDGGDLRYGINTTSYSELSGSRLGEYSLVKGRSYGDFTLSARVRSTEDFAANPWADHDVVFGWQDSANYYYAMFNRYAPYTQLFKVVGGVRQTLANSSYSIPDNEYHQIEVSRAGSLITVKADGAVIMQASDATFGAGRVGIGSFDDAVWWDDITIAVSTDTSPPSTPTNVTATAVSFSEVAVSWSASTDDVGVTGYRVYRDATLVASPTGTSASVTGLSGGVLYSFSVAAVDAAGNASAQSAPVLVTTPVVASPTVAFSAAPSAVAAGQSATLTWSSTNATSCSASEGWSGTRSTSGSQAVTPTATTTYILTCMGIGGVAAASVLVTMTTLVPAVSLSASPASIASGASSMLTWSSTDAGSCTASGGWSGTKATSGTLAVSPTSTTTYGLSCTGSGGTGSQSTTVTVAAPSAITASLVASRTSGVAPLYVFFDATGTTASATTRPFHELEYQWNFGDEASGSWSATPGMPNASRNLATGPVAAHVFETPGTYTVSLTVLDGGAPATKSVQITVTDPDTVFAANTLCVGNTQPVAGSDGCPAGAAILQSSDFDGAINNNIASRKRILFRRGDTFAAGSSANILVTGPGLIGAFGTGAAPVVNITANNDGFQLSSWGTPDIKDWRIMDLEINGNSGAETNGINALAGIDQVTLLRMNIHHVHKGAQLAPNYLDSAGPSHRLWDQWAVVDSTVRNAIGGGGGYVLYYAGQRTAVMGNVLSDSSLAEHILRMPYIYKGVFSHNAMSKAAAAKHVVKMQAASWFGAAPTVYTEQVLFSDNKFTSGDAGGWTVALGPMDNQTDERVKQVILERNWFAPGPGQNVALTVFAQDVTVRNNIFNLTGAASGDGVIVEQRGIEPLPMNVHVYNNTFYRGSTGNFNPIQFFEGAGGMVAKNNLGYAPLSTSRDMVSGVAIIQNNTTDAGILVSPGFVSPTPVVPADFVLGAGSSAINAGTAVPVFSDFFRQDRLQGGAIDLGAAESP
jgi:PKD repeat protein